MKVLNFLPMAALACSTAPIEIPKEKAKDESYLATPCRVDSTRDDFHERLRTCNANIQTHQKQAIERVAAMQCGRSETLFKLSKSIIYQVPGFKKQLAKETDLSYISEAQPYNWNVKTLACMGSEDGTIMCNTLLTEFIYGEPANTVDVNFVCNASEAEKQRLTVTRAFSHEIELDGFARGLKAEDRR